MEINEGRVRIRVRVEDRTSYSATPQTQALYRYRYVLYHTMYMCTAVATVPVNAN